MYDNGIELHFKIMVKFNCTYKKMVFYTEFSRLIVKNWFYYKFYFYAFTLSYYNGT